MPSPRYQLHLIIESSSSPGSPLRQISPGTELTLAHSCTYASTQIFLYQLQIPDSQKILLVWKASHSYSHDVFAAGADTIEPKHELYIRCKVPPLKRWVKPAIVRCS